MGFLLQHLLSNLFPPAKDKMPSKRVAIFACNSATQLAKDISENAVKAVMSNIQDRYDISDKNVMQLYKLSKKDNKSRKQLETIAVAEMKINADVAHKLSKKIHKSPNVFLADYECKKFANGETRVIPKTSVRQKDVFIVGTGVALPGMSVDDSVMEIYLLAKTCRRSGAKSVTLIVPNYPYARQDKKDGPRAAISARDVTDMFTIAQVDRIVSVDLHNPAIQGFTDKPFDNIYGSLAVIPFLEKELFAGRSMKEFVAIAPDQGGFSRSSKYAELLKIPLVSMMKKRDYTSENKVLKSEINGDRRDLIGRTAIIFDDMCDTAGTVVAAAKELIEAGANDVVIVVTHGLFSGPAMERLNNSSDVTMVICSDTVPQVANTQVCKKLKVFSMASVLSDVILRVIRNESISPLFL